jgi:hypothetical protein
VTHAWKWAIRKGFCDLLGGLGVLAPVVLVSALLPEAVGADDRVALRRDTDEAEAVLRLEGLHAQGKPISQEDWQTLFGTEPYKRLKEREASMNAPFTDQDFQAFVTSPELQEKAPLLSRSLEEWKTVDLEAAAGRILDYLPDEARIKARVFVVIKPRPNSFVFEPETDPMVFLSLKPGVSAAKFENTVAHEMHHIGLASLPKDAAAGAPGVGRALDWIEAFGEGFAMLAAAGGPSVHAHAHSAPADRARWDADMSHFPKDLAAVDHFLLAVAKGNLPDDEARRQGMAFFGEQGPWYTVGYRMAVAIEGQFGRKALIDCMRHPVTLIPRYNQAASLVDPPLPRFSTELVARLAEGGPSREPVR